MLIILNIIINFILQFTIKKLELKFIVNYINFNVNILNKQLLRIYSLYKKHLKL